MHKAIAGLSALAGLGLALVGFMVLIVPIAPAFAVIGLGLIAASLAAWRGAGLKYLAVAWAMVVGSALPLSAMLFSFAWQLGCGQMDYAGGAVFHLNFVSIAIYLLAIPMLIAALLLDRRKR